MSEVSSWSNTDAGNNLTPPDGWPEGMQPSGVNDCGRMMMGAIKRWYDTVTTGIANCLPLTGGSLSGPLTVPGLTSSGNINASGDIYGRYFYAQTVTANLDVQVGRNLGVTSGNILTAYLNSSGDIDANGAIGASTLNSSGDLNVADTATIADANISGTANIGTANVTNALTAGSLSTTGSISAASASITNSATIGNSLTVNAVVDTTHYNINGQLFASRVVDGVGTGHAICNAASTSSIILYGSNGSYYRCDNAHWFTNQAATLNVAAFVTTTGGAAAGTCFNGSGTWSTFSDGSIKEGVEPYRAGLAAALRLNPCSFRYIPGKSPFAVEGQTYYGLVAQEVEPVLPEMVGHTDDGLATLAPGHLVFVLLNSVKELEARLALLENRGG